MNKRHRAFTLTEMLVVMGIVVLFVVIAIPVVRTMTGNSSISMARNAVSALLARAREEAVAMQDYRGVLFVIDKGSNRVVGLLVRPADVQDTATPGMQNILLLDIMANRDSLSLPPGVGLHTLFNGLVPANTSSGNGDRYMGFNDIGSTGLPVPPFLVGGCILFDGDGKLSVKPYGLQLVNTSGGASGIFALLSQNTVAPASTNNTIPNSGTTRAWVPGSRGAASPPVPPVATQLGLVLFDYDAFHGQGFTDQDSDFDQTTTYQVPWPTGNAGVDGDGNHSELDEEVWLDSNSTPLLINRFDGTIIRAE